MDNISFVSSDVFTHMKHEGGHTFATCASDLPRNFNPLSYIHEIADKGFHMVSAHTGHTKTFRFTHTHEDGEGEIQAWQYECTTDNFIAVIYND